MSIKEALEKIKNKRNELEDLEKKFKLVDYRNLQQTSGGTYFVCLPKEWVETVGLKKGEKVTIVWLPDNSITLTT